MHRVFRAVDYLLLACVMAMWVLFMGDGSLLSLFPGVWLTQWLSAYIDMGWALYFSGLVTVWMVLRAFFSGPARPPEGRRRRPF